MRNPDITTTGAEVRKCDQCTEPASTCAALTNSDSIVLAHRFLCETCAAAMFAVNVKQERNGATFISQGKAITYAPEERLQRTVDRVKAKSSANERVTDFDGFRNAGESVGKRESDG